MFKKILIANRGEIARRIIKTARSMGIQTVAIYSSADSAAPFVQEADEAYWVGDAPSLSSYLNIEAIVAIAKRANVEAVHPGYGFLSENAAFAEALEQAKIVFIGPKINALKTMGSKLLAKETLEPHGIPMTPGYHGKDNATEVLLQEAQNIGFPILIKAANGGGGKGMRAVYKLEAFERELNGAKREAMSYFADETIILEKLLQSPRHVEVQIFRDHFGHTLHLFERDCSIQRRHQKIIEEAPAVDLSDTLRQQLWDCAIKIANLIDYIGAGTVEFLVEGESFYFMEMNTRLQVEHPVTEMVTGLDLVELQLLIAAREPLPYQQDDIKCQGHAIECRLCAEDPTNHFLPSIGEIQFIQTPVGNGVRIDSGVEKGSVLTQYYDPMIAKLIVHGESREEACQKLSRALAHYQIAGITTNIPYLNAIISSPAFVNKELATDFLSRHPIELPEVDVNLLLMAKAALDYHHSYLAFHDKLQRDTFGFRLGVACVWQRRYEIKPHHYHVTVYPKDANHFDIEIDAERFSITYSYHEPRLTLSVQEQTHFCTALMLNGQSVIFTPKGPVTVLSHQFSHEARDEVGQHPTLTAPMPSTIIAIHKAPGEKVQQGEQLVILEAMKMEHTLVAPSDGIIKTIHYPVGAKVAEGALIVVLETHGMETP